MKYSLIVTPDNPGEIQAIMQMLGGVDTEEVHMEEIEEAVPSSPFSSTIGSLPQVAREVMGGSYTCPTCNSPMQERKGKFGKFYGCTQYPRCRGTRDEKGIANPN